LKKNQEEKKLEKKIILSLKLHGFYVYKTASMGGAWDYNCQFNEAGISDLIVIGNGRVSFLECKTERGRQSVEQKVFQEICEKHKVKYAVVRSVKEAREAVSLFQQKKSSPTTMNELK